MNGSLKKVIKTHTLVASMFLDQTTDDKCLIQFKDGDCLNVSVGNLEWISMKEQCTKGLGKKVVAMDANKKETEFKSIADACDFLAKESNSHPTNFSSGIRGCLSGYQETAYGYTWKEVK